MKQSEIRQKLIVPAKRVVVKVGSGVLTSTNGLNTRRISHLCTQIAGMLADGREVVVVSSGAIASGFKKVGLKSKPKMIRKAQACAAVGQAGLIMAYERAMGRQGYKVAQVLMTAGDLIHRRRYVNALNTLSTLLEWGIVPIINENDTVVFNEIKFGDNDTLAGLITGLVEADLFINLTDIDGLYDRDPRRYKDARFLPVIDRVNGNIESMATKIPGALGAGGMYTKVVAARRVARRGLPSLIANGAKPDILTRIMAGEPEGTLFLPQADRLSPKKHWIAFTAKPRGRIWIDDGARKALLKKGKSLLPSGILSVEDTFDLGDSVQVLGRDGVLVAVGLTNYSSEDLRHIAGCQTSEIKTRLGYTNAEEIIHRDNLVVAADLED